MRVFVVINQTLFDQVMETVGPNWFPCTLVAFYFERGNESNSLIQRNRTTFWPTRSRDSWWLRKENKKAAEQVHYKTLVLYVSNLLCESSLNVQSQEISNPKVTKGLAILLQSDWGLDPTNS